MKGKNVFQKNMYGGREFPTAWPLKRTGSGLVWRLSTGEAVLPIYINHWASFAKSMTVLSYSTSDNVLSISAQKITLALKYIFKWCIQTFWFINNFLKTFYMYFVTLIFAKRIKHTDDKCCHIGYRMTAPSSGKLWKLSSLWRGSEQPFLLIGRNTESSDINWER